MVGASQSLRNDENNENDATKKEKKMVFKSTLREIETRAKRKQPTAK